MRLNLAYVIWCWQFEWSERWTPDSITRLRSEVNIKSMPEEDFPKMWVSSLIICCRPNCEVTESILEPLNVVLLCLYQFEDSVLKSARTNVRNGFWLLFYLMRVANCLQIIQRNLKIGLVIDIKKWNYMISHRLKFPKLSILVDNEHQLIPKLVNFYNICKHRLSYY